MKIKDATYHTCPTCENRRRETDDEYGCDECKTPIDYGGQQRMYLAAEVFRNGKPTESLQFCSWKCALKGLKKVKSDYFVSLPYLHYDDHQKGIRAKDFFDAIKMSK